MESAEHMNRLRWRCRRGMLELDVLLGEFLAHRYTALSATERSEFEAMLDEADQSLSSWFSGASIPPGNFQSIIKKILQVYE